LAVERIKRRNLKRFVEAFVTAGAIWWAVVLVSEVLGKCR
jgi:hypothetical protein